MNPDPEWVEYDGASNLVKRLVSIFSRKKEKTEPDVETQKDEIVKSKERTHFKPELTAEYYNALVTLTNKIHGEIGSGGTFETLFMKLPDTSKHEKDVEVHEQEIVARQVAHSFDKTSPILKKYYYYALPVVLQNMLVSIVKENNDDDKNKKIEEYKELFRSFESFKFLLLISSDNPWKTLEEKLHEKKKEYFEGIEKSLIENLLNVNMNTMFKRLSSVLFQIGVEVDFDKRQQITSKLMSSIILPRFVNYFSVRSSIPQEKAN